MQRTGYEQRFLRSYTDQPYTHTTLVRHNGTLLAFAMGANRRLYYAVLDLEGQNAVPIDSKNWPANPSELLFPTEIAQVGFGAADHITMPVVRLGGQEVRGEPVRPNEIDRFLSSTARLTAEAPFQVISDGKFLYVFRQAIGSDHAAAVFVKDAGGQLVTDGNGAPVPLVNNSLLMDRFILVGTTLRLNRDVRYRRSRSKYRPLNAKDTLGAQDMNNVPFFEATQELDFVQHLREGRFAVLLLPTQIADRQTWQIFTWNSVTDAMDAFTVERSRDGLFNTHGWQGGSPADNTPGIHQRSVHVTGRSVTAGLSALLYFQQEPMPMSTDGKPMKQNARVMLATATRSAATEPSYITVLDFAVTRQGTLAEAPPALTLQPMERGVVSVNELLAQTVQLEAEIPVVREALAQLQRDMATTQADLAARQAEHTGLRSRSEALNTPGAGAQFFADSAYQGASFMQPVGSQGNVLAGFHERVRSIRLDPGVAVTVYTDYDLQGNSRQYTATVYHVGETPYGIYRTPVYPPDDFTNAIRSVKVEYSPQRQAELDSLAAQISALETAMATLRQVLITQEAHWLQKRQVLADKQIELHDKRLQLMGDTALPMPLLHVDAMGMSVAGAVLGFAPTLDTPHLCESATGRLALYFRDPQEQFCVAYYDTTTTRASHALMDSHLLLLARTPGSDMPHTTVMVTPGSDVATCTVQVVNTDMPVTETWQRLPRDARQCAAVLNGQGATPTYLGKVAHALSGLRKELTLEAPMPHDYTSGAVLMLPSHGLIALRQGGSVGDTVLAIADTTFATALPAGEALYLLAYDYHTYATTTHAGYDLPHGSMLLRVLAGSTPGTLHDTPAQGVQLEGLALSPRWVADPPGNTLAFENSLDGTEALHLVAAGNPETLAIQGDATLEAWLRPERGHTADILQQQTANSRYALSLRQYDIPAAMQFNGATDWLRLPNIPLAKRSFTVEFWAKRESTGDKDTIFAQGLDGPNQQLHIGFRPNNTFTFAFYANDLNTPQTYTDADWHHWACTFDNSNRRRVIYRDGVQVAQDTASSPFLGSGDVHLGVLPGGNHWFKGVLDELRLWDHARSAQHIAADKDHRLQGHEPGLLGYWSFAERRVQDVSPQAGHGAIGGGPPVNAPSVFPDYSLVAGCGSTFVETQEHFTPQSWEHFAAVYDQSYALQFDGVDDVLDCGNSQGLNLTQDLTIEATLQVSTPGVAQGLITKGMLHAGGTNQRVPYALYLTQEGCAVFACEDAGGQVCLVSSPVGSVVPGSMTRLAVTRKKHTADGTTGGATLQGLDLGRSIGERDIRQQLDAQAPGQPQSAGPVMPGAVQERLELTLYVNGRTVASRPLLAVRLAGNDQPLEIGKAYGHAADNDIQGTAASYFHGALSDVRLWNAALSAGELHRPVTGNERGLVAWWRFEEGEGSTVGEPLGRNDASIHGAQWIVDPDPTGSTLVLYHNGVPAETRAIAAVAPTRPEAFTLGQGYSGSLDEVRIWRTARTEEQLLDNLFGRLKGEKEDLVAYYTFDMDHAAADLRVLDHSLRGNQLTASTGKQSERLSYVYSTAPIGNDAALVRNALAGVVTPFQTVIHSRPAVAEYGDLQYNAMGDLVGAMKRCYSFITNGAWNLLSGFKVGNLLTEWIGQVQFNPQVMGYIEGAPPVPGENLTESAGEDFRDATSLEVVEAENVTYTISSSQESGFDTSLSFSASLGADNSLTLVIAPLGFGYLQTAAGLKVSAKTSGKFDTSQGWSSAESQGHGSNTSRSTTVALSGSWEDADNPLLAAAYEAFGRRYVPANVGFAVVQSETADVFAVRLAHTLTLLSYRFRPNRDIPRDVNLIPFPIDPRYTKQGTLDGAVGYGATGKILDPDYANARGVGEYSYFKPREAYALRNRLRQEEQQLKTFYENFHPSTSLGEAAAGGLDVIKAAVGSQTANTLAHTFNNTSQPSDTYAAGYAKRNIVNTYVWTAAGGFYAEATETTQVKQETTGSSYAVAAAAGVDLAASFNVFGADVGLELNAEAGGQLNVTKSISKESTTAFGINVAVNVPGDTQTPGKVDAYRFFTFSLEPAPEHCDHLFQQVIDPIWLAQSPHPHAMALRQAHHPEKKPPCWRVFHRVTFVSRILAAIPEATTTPMEAALRAAHIDSNWLLIQRLEPFVRAKTHDFGVFAEAVREALRQALPELQPQAADIIAYLALYYGITEV